MERSPRMEGYLSKWIVGSRTWERRYFVLEDNLLRYYRAREMIRKSPSSARLVDLVGAVVIIEDGDQWIFSLKTQSKSTKLSAHCPLERSSWVNAIEEAIRISQPSTLMIIRHEDHPATSRRRTELLHETVKQQKIKSSDTTGTSASTEESSGKVKFTDSLFFAARSAKEAIFETPTIREEIRKPCTAMKESKSENNSSSFMIDSSDRSTSMSTGIIGERDRSVFDYDAMYEDSAESDLSLESHGSIITHLISQVKIGMDLTKVTLPTYILERRSLLEMYADSFSHTEQFIRIADMPTPEERMIQVVRWYLTSFHASRKTKAPKKPYNPVLGEIFRCYWEVDGDRSTEYASSGPVPWAKKNNLTFIAEQVSHHPPVSAFYAEHIDKRIYFNAHVWTKSKFLGLSIGVHNLGTGTVHVLDHDEKYDVTFPNGYGRSILTTPWIELGGSVEIRCEKTGYRATIDFLTKPFYGGKKHRISGQIFSPDSKKPVLTVSGEWTGRLMAKWSGGQSEVFADVDELYLRKKVVRSVAVQEDNESRRLWRDVTAGLKLHNVNYATKAKADIEEKQRHLALTRETTKTPWIPEYFHPGPQDRWYYKMLLNQRLQLVS